MSNNPIQEHTFKHYLNFKNPNFGTIEISEMVKFDGFSFDIKQHDKGYGRDKTIGGREIGLEFHRGFFEPTPTPQTLPDGLIHYNLTHGLDYIFQAYKQMGMEAEVEYILKKDGVDFVMGLLDFAKSKTNLIDRFECNLVQDTKKALIERRKDLKIDVFSDKDLDLNTIVPVAKKKVLIKAKPIITQSKWTSQTNAQGVFLGYGQDGVFINTARQLTKYGINFSFALFSSVEVLPSFIPANDLLQVFDRFKIIKAFNRIDNLKISISNINILIGDSTGFYTKKSFYLSYGTHPVNNRVVVPIFSTTDTVINYTNNFTYTIPTLQVGETVWLRVEIFQPYSVPASTPVSSTFYNVKFDADATATETAVDTVVDGVDYYNYLKHGIKVLSGLPINAPEINVGGRLDKQFVFNGNMIRGNSDKPFLYNHKDEMDDLEEFNFDYQINDNDFDILHFDNFYENIDLGAFLQAPNQEIEFIFNERFQLNQLDFNYKTFETDKDTANTIDDVHTEMQFALPNLQVENKKKIEINHIRSAFAIEKARRDGLKKTTALQNDDKVFLIDCEPLAPNSTGTFTTSLLHQVQANGNIKILSNVSGSQDDLYVNWNLLGLSVGQIFTIISGGNAGSYTVVSLSPNIIELQPQTGTIPNYNGQTLNSVSYVYTSVLWITATNQRFNSITGVANGDNFANLKYTIQRNLRNWFSYLSSAVKWQQSKTLKNTAFKNDVDLISQLNNGEIIHEKGNITVAQMGTGLLSPIIISCKVVISFTQAVQLINDMKALKGFIRIIGNDNRVYRVYLRECKFIWVDGVLEIVKGEIKNESDYIEISSGIVAGEIIINEVGYSINTTTLGWYEINNGFVQFFDNLSRPLISVTDFKFIKINGVLFTSETSFVAAINNL